MKISSYENSKSGICYFPAPFVYFYKVENHKDIKEKLLPEIEEDLKINADKIKNDWCCDVTSSFHFSQSDFLFKNDLLMDQIWKAYNGCVDQLIYDELVSNDTDIRQCIMDEMWYNIYEKGGNQEIHCHKPFDFSGIYILDDTQVNNTIFWYEANMFPTGLSPYISFDHPAYEGTSVSEVGEGYIIIFPGSLPHYVPNVKDKKISLSFNFTCTSTEVGTGDDCTSENLET